MGKGIWVVFTNCTDPSRHEEFNRWYCHTHLPDLSASRGFVRARRYANAYPDEGPSQYLALYEFEDEDIPACVEDLRRNARETMLSGRHIDCLGVANLYMFQEMEKGDFEPLGHVDYGVHLGTGDLGRIPEFRPLAKTGAGANRVVFTNCSDPAREDEFNRWYFHTHLPELMHTSGMVATHRYRNLKENWGPSRYLATYEFETNDLRASLLEMDSLAIDARKGTLIDCLELIMRPLFIEIDAGAYKPLEKVEYPAVILTPPHRDLNT